MKKAGIIGSGLVGRTLASGFAKHGREVMIGSNDAKKREELGKSLGGIAVGTFAEAAAFGDLVVLAVKGTGAEKAVEYAGAPHLDGKTVIDTTNPIAEEVPENGVLRYFTGPNESLMERLQNKMPGAHFVKAFSCIGNAHMVNPDFGAMPPTMFYCGNDEGAKAEVKKILEQFGFDPADMGKAEAARAIEPLAMLWCIPGFLHNEWNHAFRLLKK
jgi:predicted dinucleotide-binding enzyme